MEIEAETKQELFAEVTIPLPMLRSASSY